MNNPRWPDVRIDKAGGVPVLLKDGKPWFGWAANRPIAGDHYEVFERLAAQGLRHFHVDATCSEDIYHPELRFWHGPENFDGSFQHRHFRRLADICPDALFQLRIYASAPPWWLKQHPDHCQVYADGHGEHNLQRAGRHKLPSLASPLWRQEACRALSRYIQWLVETGWNRRVSALFLCYGITWEWGLLGSDDFLDYSEHGQRYFREWRIQHGREPVPIPSPERRAAAHGPKGLRHLPDEQDVIDHQQALSDMNADFLLALADTAKKASGGEALVGAFYGYTLTAREQSKFTGMYGAGGFHGGHHALGRILRSSSIDFLASPFNYADRALGSGQLLEHVPLASVHAHGKAFFDENDLWAWNNPPQFEAQSAGCLSVGYTPTRAETILQYRRAWAQAIVRGKHQWLTELTEWVGDFRENFSDPVLLAEIKRLNAESQRLVEMDRRSVAEMAFVLDEHSVAHLSLDHQRFKKDVYQASVGWGHCGTPFDLLLLEDLMEWPAPRYKLVVIACVKSAEAMTALRRWAVANPSALLWWNDTMEWYPPADPRILIHQMHRAGVHRFVEDDSTVWSNTSMIGVHVNAAGRRTVRFRCPARGIELFSKHPFDAAAGHVIWDFAERDVALFISAT